MAATWVEMFPATTPGARFLHLMAYDQLRAKTVLYGGYGPGGGDVLKGDTFEWDGADWADVTPMSSPPRRAQGAMAYDEIRQETVLFGGEDNHSGIVSIIYYDDTWTFDGTTWTQKFPAVHPPPLSQCNMAYDPRSGCCVLYGGLDFTNPALPVHSLGTWLWNGTTWRHVISPREPGGRRFPVMSTTVLGIRYLLLFGGALSTGPDGNDTWRWNGDSENWELLAPSTPSSRAGYQMAPSGDCGVVVMFSMDSIHSHIQDDTTLWSDVGVPNWAAIVYVGGPPGTILGNLAPDPIVRASGQHGVVLFGGQIEIDPAGDTAVVDQTWVYYCDGAPPVFAPPVFRNRWKTHH